VSKRRTQATIPEPYPDPNSLYATAMATKELVESLAGQRGGPDDVAVTWGDLIRLGWVSPSEVKGTLGPYRPE
jgi:hypothetical protein